MGLEARERGLEVPNSRLARGTWARRAIILDVDWDDNPYTDIDVLWLTETAHGYYDDDPDSYGPSTFFIEERSVNNHATSGQHNWGTYTGTSRETFAVPATSGLTK